MAIKFSSANCLETELRYFVEGIHNSPRISRSDKKNLKGILNEMEVVHSNSLIKHPFGLIECPHLSIHGYDELVTKSNDPQRSAELLEQVHAVLKQYRVRPKMYKLLGGVFSELGLRPNRDIEEAIDFGTALDEYQSAKAGRYSLRSEKKMRWDVVNSKNHYHRAWQIVKYMLRDLSALFK